MPRHRPTKSGSVLRVVSMSSTCDARHAQADDRARGGHAVVVVGAESPAVQGSPARCAARRRSRSRRAEPAELGGEGGEAVGLVPADVRDAADPRRGRREGRESGDRGGQLRRVVQVDVDADELTAADDGEARSGRAGRRRPSCRGSRAAGRRPGWCAAASRARAPCRPRRGPQRRTGPALERSGSTDTSSALISDGSTRHVLGSLSSTIAPASRSVSTVIRMWGSLGTGLPSWCTVTPSS